MTPSKFDDQLHGSIEGTLRPAGLRPEPKQEKTPARDRAKEAEAPFVLYGRLGYIRRDRVDGAVHHNPPSEG